MKKTIWVLSLGRITEDLYFKTKRKALNYLKKELKVSICSERYGVIYGSYKIINEKGGFTLDECKVR